MNPITDPTLDHPMERLARKRARAKLGWYVHALVYITVNLALFAAALSHGRSWAVFPALGWGLGLAIHGAVVFFLGSGSNIHERLVQRERALLIRQQP